MKRYKFRLAQVLRVRRIELDRAEGAIAQARAELARARQHTADREQIYRDLAAAGHAGSLDELRTRVEHQRLAADAIMLSRAAERGHEQIVAQRLVEWAEADKKVRLLEQLDERARERHRFEAMAEEQQLLDDLVTSRRSVAA